MPKKNRVGIDPSLTNTGLFFGPDQFYELKGGKLKGAERLQYFKEEMRSLFEKHKPDMAIVEGYAFAAHNNRSYRLGELGGIIRVALLDCGCSEIVEVPPSSLKKWATGFGNASKFEMIQVAEEKCGHDLPGHDVADAALLYFAGLDAAFLNKKGTRI